MRRALVVTGVLIALLLGGAWLLYGSLFDTPPPLVPIVEVGTPVRVARDAGPAHEPVVVVTQAQVSALTGRVEVRSTDGTWRPAALGDVLGADDAVRTGRGAEATLSVGDGITVRLSPRSAFQVREITEGLARVQLERGHVRASVTPDGDQVLRVETPGSDAVAESAGGEFGVVTDGDGQLTVATETGRVKLRAAGGEVEVGAGETSTARDGKRPTTPRPIPKSLYVKLGDIQKRRTNRPYTNVVGRTDPGSVVHVGQKLAVLDDRGRFKVRVPLREGVNVVGVEVRDASGRIKDVALPKIELDRKKPEIETEMDWGNGN